MTKTHIGDGAIVYSHMRDYLVQRREAKQIPRGFVWGVLEALGVGTLWFVFIMQVISESQNIH